MKKNESLGYIIYVVMLAIAVIIGFTVIRPDFQSDAAKDLTMHPAAITVLSIVVGIILTALFLEIGHVVGAKIGKYKIDSVIVLGAGFKTKKSGKKRMTFSAFDGLSGETVIVPKDVKKSDPRVYTWFSNLFILLEVIICVILIVYGAQESKHLWLKIAGEVILTISVMVLVYNIFPAALDSKNDGYLFLILNSKSNREAYNYMLLASHQIARGETPDELPIYDEVTDFTASVNDVALYARLQKRDFDGAIEVLDKTLSSKKKVSGPVYQAALFQKTAIIVATKPLEEAKEFYLALSLEDKKHMAALNSAQAVRAYVLVNAIIEESESETAAGLERVNGRIHRLPAEKKDIEKGLMVDAMKLIHEKHPAWDFSDINAWAQVFGEPEESAPEEPQEEPESTEENTPEE